MPLWKSLRGAAVLMGEFKGFEKKIWLSSPTMHGKELEYMKNAYETNWMSTVGENIDKVEEITCKIVGCKHAAALASGTAALHMTVRLAAKEAYGISTAEGCMLHDKKVFVSDLTFAASVNPILYEGGTPVFIDSEPDTWNMNPKALEQAFNLYPDTKIVIVTHLYGTPAKADEIKEICEKHKALLIEDAAESLGAYYRGKSTGNFGDFAALSFNGNKIITGSSGGMFLGQDKIHADRVRKWATQSREGAAWYQHEEVGYNYRMSNVVAGVIRGQYEYLEEHIEQKKRIYKYYKKGFEGMPVKMNPFDENSMTPNFWLSCMTIEPEAMCRQQRTGDKASYTKEKGKSCPTEILEALGRCNAEGRPIWKPMHMQPVCKKYGFVTAATADGSVSEDIFGRGLCLPSDNKMTVWEQDKIIEIIKSCFR